MNNRRARLGREVEQRSRGVPRAGDSRELASALPELVGEAGSCSSSGLRDRVQAVVIAYESGFVVPDDNDGESAAKSR
jgi:hypothetical protein